MVVEMAATFRKTTAVVVQTMTDRTLWELVTALEVVRQYLSVARHLLVVNRHTWVTMAAAALKSYPARKMAVQ